MKKLCVIGGGRWGQNHIRTLFQMGCLAGIVESDPKRLSELLALYPVKGFVSLDDALDKRFDGYILATPAPTHYLVGKKLLKLGQHVLIEKPMTLSPEHAKELVQLSERKNASLMVGHLLLFHPAIQKIKEIIDSGKLGKIYYIYSTRLNLGTVRTEENVFWSFAPHDISVLDYFIGQPAEKIEAKGAKYLQDQVYDFTMAQLTYPGNINAHIFVSWLHPFKEQRLVVVGSNGMISFDDASKEKNIMYYNKTIKWENGLPLKAEEPDELVPYVKSQPLQNELQYFMDHLGQKIEIAGGKTGYEVVKVLDTVGKQIEQNPA